MDFTAEEHFTLRRYLLGQLTPAQRAPLEERLLGQSDFYEELSIIEDELIDLYLAGGLDAPERESFERHFLLAPEHRRKLGFARTLRRYVAVETAVPHELPAESPRPAPADPIAPPAPVKRNPFRRLLPQRRPALAFSLACALLVAVVAVSWLFIGRRPPVHEPRNVYAVTLTPGLTRDAGETKRIALPPDADTLRLRLELPAGEYESYRAALLDVQRAEIWAADQLKPAARDGLIDVDVPARLLKREDYQVKVSGRPAAGDGALEDVASYSFRAAR